MENIIEPNETFDFSKISLTNPISIQGGAYFTKIQYDNKSLYIQTPKSLSRQGIVKSGKKYYCDLMFDQYSEILIRWFENLEETCQQFIYEKSDTWFQSNLEKSDIESAFNSIVRTYKSGKFFLVRTNCKSTSSSNDPSVKIYNENEIPLAFSDITNETNIISILEIQGIKFTSRNFQIEIELKQIMVLDNEPIFDNCLIKTIKREKKQSENDISVSENSNSFEEMNMPMSTTASSLDNFMDLSYNSFSIMEEAPRLDDSLDDLVMEENHPSDNIEALDNTNLKDESKESNETNDTETPLDFEIEELENLDLETGLELKEVDVAISSENPLETFSLKQPNQVYFELYKEARKKAKEAKKNLILAYLEAKNIKKTYLLDTTQDSDDSDLDAEIDEITEEELEGL
jgi:hypothetical protein